MYENLGLHWAGSIPAFLALLCVPMPFIFWKYGPAIRSRCKYAAEAQAFMKKMQAQMDQDEGSEEEEQSEDSADKDKEHEEEREEAEQEAIDYSYEPEPEQPQLEPIKSTASRPAMAQRYKSYENSPFDLDRKSNRLGGPSPKYLSLYNNNTKSNRLTGTNTKESFRWEAARMRRSSKSSKGSER